jgi:eukaryotic-like serine/threonine-protein kinase
MNEETLFHAALERANLAERAAFLDGACAGMPELRAAVEALLKAHEASGAFLNPPADTPATIDSASVGPTTEATGVLTPSPGASIAPASITVDYRADARPNVLIAGRYSLHEKIGEGGMGEVWVAKQSEPVKRKVALKLIKTGMDSRAVLQRFEQERQALAMMDHPNIAKVLDAGLTPTGQPFFVMELVNGLPLNKFCDELKLTPKERLELFVPICQAVQHAHQKGIVHRDLKPANILITMIDARPVPKVIDFGVAKATAGRLTAESISTQFGAVVGTLEYMSPEQASFSGEDIDTRADIYSLGVILYELLTGLRPIDAVRLKKAALTEMIRIIREEEPSKPSTRLSTDALLPSLAALRQTEPRKLMTMLRGELDWVVMKCLEKQRERRYETANALARDIQRYLADEAVEARPPSAGYRFQKFVSRNKGQVIAASLVLLTLVAGIIGTSIGLVRADRARNAEATQRKIAVEEKKKAEESEKLARQQRTRAEEREEQAIETVKKFRDAVANNPELKNNPALEPLRKRLLKEPLEFFKALRDQLQADNDTRPESLARLAGAALELAHLTDEIGDKRDSIRAYQESLAIWERLASDHPKVPEFIAKVVETQNNLGILLRETGDLPRARKALEQARDIIEPLSRQNPAVADYASLLAKSLGNLSYVRMITGDLTGARKVFEQARDIQERLAREHPTVSAYAWDLARTQANLGILLNNVGDRTGARQAWEQASDIQGRLAREHPNDAGYSVELARMQSNLGVLLSDTGELPGARKEYEQARDILQRLVREYPAVSEYANDLAGTCSNLGLLLEQTGNPAEARKEFDLAVEIRERLAREHPAVTEYTRDLADIRANLSTLLRNTGDLTGARRECEMALTIDERLAREHPDEPDNASHLGGALSDMASLDILSKRFAHARDRVREAITWQRKALAANPANPVYRKFLVNHLNNLIITARALGDAESVAEAERELTKLRDSDPSTKALDARLSAIIKGDQEPNDNAEWFRLAQRAYDKSLYATAARLWSEALETNPELADNRQAQHRYNAACAASLAGCGQGQDDPSPDEAAKDNLRKQALDWLKEEMAVWLKFVESGPPQAKAFMVQTLDHWKKDTDLAGIRDEKALAKLPEPERKEWQSLWSDVDAFLKRTQEKGSVFLLPNRASASR